jgi:ribosomal protein S18 acetylase RimI-like enzyme
VERGEGWSAVRPALWEDLDELLRLLSQLHEDEPPLVRSAEREAVFARMLATPGRTVLVSEGAGSLTGTLDIRVFENLTHDARPWAEIEKVVVDRAHRRRGVGAALLDAAHALAREAGCFKVQLLSRAERTEAHALYERAGFDAHVRGFRRYL